VRSRLFIDGQHAIFTRESIAHIAHTALGCGITPLARVHSVDDQDVERLSPSAHQRRSIHDGEGAV
jgi:2-keto-3-deoxy-L-rhamnonate aldolase RhmA